MLLEKLEGLEYDLVHIQHIPPAVPTTCPLKGLARISEFLWNGARLAAPVAIECMGLKRTGAGTSP